jgi:PGF-CTERM protein
MPASFRSPTTTSFGHLHPTSSPDSSWHDRAIRSAASSDITGIRSAGDAGRSTTENSPFLKQPTAIVQPDGSFTAVADFSDNSPNTNFTAETSISDDEIDGTIGAAPSASVSISDQESNGETVVVDSATLSEGGFIAIHNGSASGDVIGASSYLEAGSHEDVEVTLNTTQSEDFTAVAMPHLDTDGDQTYDFPENDGPYTSNGSAVTDSAAVTITTGEQTTTEQTTEETTTEQTTTEETTTEEATTMETTTEETTTGDSGPGFTAVIALVALVAAALLAVRRDN